MNISCEKKEELRVFEAFYQRLPEGSAECGNVPKAISSCNIPHVVTLVQDKCNGQRECLLDHTKEVKPIDAMKCQKIMYLKILYRCGRWLLFTTTWVLKFPKLLNLANDCIPPITDYFLGFRGKWRYYLVATTH